MIEHPSAAEIEKAVVDAYLAGEKIADIRATHHLAQATVYWILERNGVAPDRAHRRGRLLDESSASTLLELIEHQNRRIEEVERAATALRAAVAEVDGEGLATIEALLVENERLRGLVQWWRTKHPRTKDPEQGT